MPQRPSSASISLWQLQNPDNERIKCQNQDDFRKGYQEENPNIKSMRNIGKACGEKWKTMTYEEKVQYYDIATEKRAEFERALQEYNKKKELGEDEESEDVSEFDE